MKKKILKRVAILSIAMVTISLSAGAQERGDMAAGANLLFGTTSGYSNIGFGANFKYNIIDQVRLAAEFDYFLKKDYVSMWSVNVYGHYLFSVADNVIIYPLAGLGIIGATNSYPAYSLFGYDTPAGSLSSSHFDFAIGGGAEYDLTSHFALNGELRLQFDAGIFFCVALGAAYKF